MEPAFEPVHIVLLQFFGKLQVNVHSGILAFFGIVQIFQAYTENQVGIAQEKLLHMTLVAGFFEGGDQFGVVGAVGVEGFDEGQCG